MDIAKSPQYQLYLLTLLLFNLWYDLVPDGCDFRCIDATIINRAYYSSYLLSILWLLEVHGYKLKSKRDFPKGSRFVTEHAQARDAVRKYGDRYLAGYLSDLAILRNKADYYPDKSISTSDLHDAIAYMESIFQGLKFE